MKYFLVFFLILLSLSACGQKEMVFGDESEKRPAAEDYMDYVYSDDEILIYLQVLKDTGAKLDGYSTVYEVTKDEEGRYVHSTSAGTVMGEKKDGKLSFNTGDYEEDFKGVEKNNQWVMTFNNKTYKFKKVTVEEGKKVLDGFEKKLAEKNKKQ
ncbi:hypothetical protein [Peribacillus sp. SCS-37]|uniref:hypothetical protein n=1 Tax=Paraperibacillus esterisolvens TaxID=3115296 RepID=UPI00390630BA